MSNQPTSEPTADPADIGPEDLWLVWYHNLPGLGDDPIGTSWALAARGPEGLESLTKEEHMATG